MRRKIPLNGSKCYNGRSAVFETPADRAEPCPVDGPRAGDMKKTHRAPCLCSGRLVCMCYAHLAYIITNSFAILQDFFSCEIENFCALFLGTLPFHRYHTRQANDRIPLDTLTCTQYTKYRKRARNQQTVMSSDYMSKMTAIFWTRGRSFCICNENECEQCDKQHDAQHLCIHSVHPLPYLE